MANPNLYYEVLDRPHVTEKTSVAQAEFNKYAFRVPSQSNKSEIKKAIETLFEVTVEKINVINVPGKHRRMMGRPGKTRDWKKVIVTLKDGDTIETV